MLKGSRSTVNDLAHATSGLVKRVNWNAVRDHAPGDVGKRSHGVHAGAVASLMLTAFGLAAGAVVMYLLDPRNGVSRRTWMRAGLDRWYARMRRVAAVSGRVAPPVAADAAPVR